MNKLYLKRARQGAAIGLSLGMMLTGTPADAATAHAQADSVAVTAVGAEALQGLRGWDEPAQNWAGRTGSRPTGVPADPAKDKPDFYADKGTDGQPCHARHGQTRPARGCLYGDKSGGESWVVVGNSKSGTYVDILGEIGAREGWSVRAMTKSATAFTPGVFKGESRTWNDAVLAEIKAVKPDVVAMVASTSAEGDYTGQLNTIVTKTLGAGAGHVVLLWDPPTQKASALETKAKAIAASNSRVSFVTVEDWVCNDGTCPVAIGGITVKGSGSHLTDAFADTLVNPLHARLNAAGLADSHPGQVKRIAGEDRYETAALLSYGDGGNYTREVFVANGTTWPDALAASAQTGTTTKLVLTRPNSVPKSVIEAGNWLYDSYATARVLGGPNVVGTTVVDTLAKRYESVNRVAGANRYETAVLIAEDVDELIPTKRVFITSGQTWADSVTAASVADPEQGDVLLLTQKGNLPNVTAKFLSKTKPTEVVVVGGPLVVSDSVVNSTLR